MEYHSTHSDLQLHFIIVFLKDKGHPSRVKFQQATWPSNSNIRLQQWHEQTTQRWLETATATGKAQIQ